MTVLHRRVGILLTLIFAGEIIFSLPFHIARFFRPTFLDAFSLTNAQIGDAFAVYGVTAMLAYFPGGAIADRFSARNLLVISLLATALGGLYMMTFPNGLGLKLLFAWWGVTTIFLFWAAMIKATREWGGSSTQGRAFGLLDGGRGLVAAGAATLAVMLLNTPAAGSGIDEINRQQTLHSVIIFYTGLNCLAALLVWFFVPATSGLNNSNARHSFCMVLSTLQEKRVWLQAIIVICAYCGYKGLDFFSLYAVDVLNMEKASAEKLATWSAYIRPVAAISAGFLADRLISSRVIFWGFCSLLISYTYLAFALPNTFSINIIYTNLIITFVSVFAIRAVYFALLEESHQNKQTTGAAVGVISLVGFTPDIFFAPIAGRLIDASPGVVGHHHFYGFLVCFALVGVTATLGLRVVINGNQLAKIAKAEDERPA